MDVLVAIDAENLKDEAAFVRHLVEEGFEEIPEEEGLVFTGVSSTPVMHTRAYILEVLTKALERSPASLCNFVCQIGENPFESYCFSREKGMFIEVE